ncbi:MAG: ABC transporter ATP-binding protein [Saprospiraceae bacterium]|uniref:ABC transporter ATP-binding protein n=1 Tax=Candidatus Opimibacter skivensis TaxID=2982028 RepID=A0A9D7XUI0_9BACT|nr:ABC transporter ATP-binding protein [Candidatus Opimibacter skivensis]
MSDIILQTNQLSKRFSKRILAVDALDLTISRNQIFGILGPNGSGKTTTLGMVLGVVSITNGTYSWFEKGDDFSLRKRIGAILEQPNFYPFLSASQNLIVHSRIKDIRNPDTEGLLKLVNLYERRNDPFKTYSLGMKQRLAIASALLADPEVLIFDEPTNGLDPQGIAEIRKLILDIRDMNKTIILASHLLDEVQKVCSHFAVLQRGKKIYSGSVADALQQTNTVLISADAHQPLWESIQSCPGITSSENGPDVIKVNIADGWSAASLNKYLVDKNISVNYIQQKKSSLEEKFLDLLRQNDNSQNQPVNIKR